MRSLTDFIVSRVRVKLFTIFFSTPEEMFYVRQLVRECDEEINAIRRELDRLTKAGIVRPQARGNRLYFSLNKQYLFYPELMRLVTKISGLGAAVIKNQQQLGKVKFVFLSGRFVRRMPYRQDAVDLLVVGEIVMPQLASIVQQEQIKVKREINYSVMSEEEFKFRKSRRDPFILDVLKESRIMLIGDEEELAE